MGEPVLAIQMLGEFRLVYRGTTAISLTGSRLQSLLAYLMLHPGASHPRAHLAALFWPECPDAQARANLRQLVFELRRRLPEPDRFLDVDQAAVRWRENAPYTLDAAEFEHAVREVSSPAALERAASLYRGDLLPGLYEDWVVGERDRLHRVHVDLLKRLVAVKEARRDHVGGLQYAHRLLDQDPLEEETYRALMRLHGATGNRNAVMRTYQSCEAVLRRELDVAPSQATREAYERILRTVDRPAEAPPPPPAILHNLPHHPSSFIGRQAESAEVKRLLTATRLLTLTGMGGCGKTRLALRVAHDLVDEYLDGVWLVDLAPLNDGGLIPPSVASVLEISEEPGRPLVETLVASLRDKALLLILDNCEHLADAGAALVEALLTRCPGLRILATSRQGLNVGGEVTWLVPPLSLPDPDATLSVDTLGKYDAVRLFVERATAVRPAFAITPRDAGAVIRLCRGLDGLPLAIELAAARVKAISVEEIVARLDDRFGLLTGGSRTTLPRHQTLRGVMDWSYQLLPEPERLLLQRLAVFAGGWTLEAAEAVCQGEGIPQRDVLEILSQLVDKSLVMMEKTADGTARYRFLDTVHQYARERLLESGTAERLRAGQCDYFATLAELAEPQFWGGEQEPWFERCEAEHDNMRAVLSWALEHVPEAGLRLAGALWRCWEIRGHLSEGRGWLERLLAATAGSRVPPALRAKALNGAGVLARDQGDYQQARALHEEALALRRGLGDKRAIATSLNNLGIVAKEQGAYEEAITLHEEALALRRDLGDRWGIAASLNSLGVVAQEHGDHDRAAGWYEQSAALLRQLRDKQGLAVVLNNLGNVALASGDYGRAADLHEQSLALSRELGNERGIAVSLTNLAELALQQGRLDQAVRWNAEALALQRDAGAKEGVASCLEGFARIACARGECERAARLFGAAEALRDSIGAPLPPIDRAEYERGVAAAHTGLGDDAFEEARARGRATPLDEVIRWALAVQVA